MEQANSVTAFLKILERYNSYPEKYFRGQLEKYPSISPAIDRDPGYAQNESAIYHESIQLKSDEFKDLHNPLEILAKQQHYGIPTRLVDVTIDPLISLFFAVEDTDDKSPGNVLVYIRNGFPSDSVEVQLLSLLPTIDALSIEDIKDQFKKLFSKSISEDDIARIVGEPVFVQFSDMLEEVNPRLFHQKGTFLICGNEIVEERMTKKLKSLDSIKPNLIIRIPYEYKKSIKEELDLQYGINQPSIYPELPSVAGYIKEKYKKSNLSLDGKYSIVNVKDSSFGLIRRVSVTVVLNDIMPIEHIKAIVINVIEANKNNNDVVWIYVARNGDDYITSNWVVRGQWIVPSLDKPFRPVELSQYEDGYYWDYEKSYSTLADYYDEYVFEDDISLYVYHKIVWEDFIPVLNSIQECFRAASWNDFRETARKSQQEITCLYMKLQDFGHSRNKSFDDFLTEISNCIAPIDDIRFLLDKNHSEQDIKRIVQRSLHEAEALALQIEDGFSTWGKTLNVTKSDYVTIDPQKRERKRFNYTPTMPVSETALQVDFSVSPVIHEDKALQIEGATNLFDYAVLSLTMRDNSRILYQTKATVENGRFAFPTLSNKGNGFDPGEYHFEISLSIPSVQPKEFTKKAGIEYENLARDFIVREGAGPCGRYVFSVAIE